MNCLRSLLGRQKKKGVFVAFAVVEVAALVYFIQPFFRTLDYQEFDFSQMQLVTEQGVLTETGYFIEESSGYQGMFTYKPYLNLAKGSYLVTLNYEATGEGNTCTLSSLHPTSFRAIRCDDILLSQNQTSVTFQAYLKEDISAVHLITSYAGEGSLLVHSVEVEQTYDMAISQLITACVCIMLINCILYAKYTRKFKKITAEQKNVAILLSGMVLFCSYPLFTLGLTRGSDLVFHLLRIEGLKDGMLAGDFPVRIQPTWLEGYGYAVSVFYGDLLIYFPAVLRLLGYSLQASYKIFLFAMNVATCYTAYYCIRKIVKNRYISVLGSALYVMAPYRLYGLYVVARVGECAALVFIPLIVAGLYDIFMKDCGDKGYSKTFLVPMIGYVGLVNSHVLLTQIVVVFTVLVCLLCICRVFRKRVFCELLKAAVLSLLVSAAYIIPFLDYYMNHDFHVNTEQDAMWIQSSGVQISQLVQMFPSWNSQIEAFAGPGYSGMENAGIVVIAFVGLFLYTYFVADVQNGNGQGVKMQELRRQNAARIIFVFGMLAVFLSTCYFPWDAIRKSLIPYQLEVVVDSIQRPTRFMPVATILLIISGCIAIRTLLMNERYTRLAKYFVAVSVILLIILTGYYTNFMINSKEQESITDLQKFALDHTWSRGEYMPANTDTGYLTSIGVSAGDGVKISDYYKEYLDIKFHVINNTEVDSYVDLPLVYYEGYVAYDCADTETEHMLNVYNGHNNNVVRVDIPAGYVGDVRVEFKEPVSWRISEFVSLGTLLCLMIISFRWRMRKDKVSS